MELIRLANFVLTLQISKKLRTRYFQAAVESQSISPYTVTVARCEYSGNSSYYKEQERIQPYI